jgi:hypothetical protein
VFLNPVCHWGTDPSLCQGDLLSLTFDGGPAKQEFPTTAAGLAAALGIPAATPSNIWLCDEASGNLVDTIGSVALSPQGGPLQGRNASGFGNGNGKLSGNKTCVEFHSTENERFAAPNNTLFDFGVNDSFAFLMVWRGRVPIGNEQFFSKITVPGDKIGYNLKFTAGTHNLSAKLFGSGASGASITTGVGSIGDGPWHPILWILNRTTDLMYLLTESIQAPTTNIATLTTLSNNVPFILGGDVVTGEFGAQGGQIAYFAAFEGAAAEALGTGVAAVASFWTHGQHPSGLVSQAPFNASAKGSVIDYDSEIGVRFHDWAVNQITYEANPVLPHSSKLAYHAFPLQSRMVTFMDRYDGGFWTRTNVTASNATADLDDSPRDMQDAQKVTATANGGYLHQNLAGEAGGSTYTMRIYVKRHSSMGSDVAGKLIFWSVGGGVEVASIAFTATTLWQAIDLTAVSTGNDAMRIQIDTSGESIALTRVSCSLGSMPTDYWDEAGNSPWQRRLSGISSVAEEWIHAARGEVRVLFAMDNDDDTGDKYHCDFSPSGGGNIDRHINIVRSNEKIRRQYYNAAAGSFTKETALGVPNLSASHVLQYQWDAANPLTPGIYERIILDGVIEDGWNAAWAVNGGVLDRLHIGIANNNNNPLKGFISAICCYADPQPPVV